MDAGHTGLSFANQPDSDAACVDECPSASIHPITVQTMDPMKFYRLIYP